MLRRLLLGTTLLMSIPSGGAFAGERSLAIGYGPANSVHLTLNRNDFGLYANPFVSYHNADYYSQRESAIHLGGMYSYRAFTYRQMECRAQLGAGVHGAYLLIKDDYTPDHENRQWGVEAWIQPEFRFYERFALLLEANVLKYTWEQDDRNQEYRTQEFSSPDFSVSELKVGFRYYFQFRKNG
ncbi:MAG: hypothetical protein JWO30_3656 [Fibrobacteres bacterium]|nr:hypothetical protein [Fibrobacterota bacterium]